MISWLARDPSEGGSYLSISLEGGARHCPALVEPTLYRHPASLLALQIRRYTSKQPQQAIPSQSSSIRSAGSSTSLELGSPISPSAKPSHTDSSTLSKRTIAPNWPMSPFLALQVGAAPEYRAMTRTRDSLQTLRPPGLEGTFA